MIRLGYLQFAAGIILVACTHHAPAEPRAKADYPIRLIEHGVPSPAGFRIAFQFDNEPPIVQVSDGRGGPPLLYHGHDLNPDQVRSIVVLKTKDARQRFGDQTLDAAILIELK